MENVVSVILLGKRVDQKSQTYIGHENNVGGKRKLCGVEFSCSTAIDERGRHQ